MWIKLILLATILFLCASAPQDDIMPKVPGYPDDFPTAVYTGYLSTGNSSRGIHYVFVQSINGPNNKDPVTLWLNGGPGCSSLLGFLQQIGPYYLEEGIDYKVGDKLTFNKYSWHNVSNLLFFQSPAGVGYSYNLDTSYVYNDQNTAQDNLNAVLDFFKKFPQYTKNGFWIAGQSYAGKYIPDLAVLIDKYNLKSPPVPVNMKGILVGNGVMSFQNDELQKSQIQFMIGHQFIDPQLLHYWKSSCKIDPASAGCRYFYKRYQDNVQQINPYSVYDYCYYNDSFVSSTGQRKNKFASQQSILQNYINSQSKLKSRPKFNGAPCAYFDGIHSYFNQNEVQFHAKFKGMQWNGPCAQNITYNIDRKGSIASYRYLLSRIHLYQIVVYNGDWDGVVPYNDNIKNILKLNLVESYLYTPWFTQGQHSGFQMVYSGIIYVSIKGASHQVPQSKRAEAFNLFSNTLAGHPALKSDQSEL